MAKKRKVLWPSRDGQGVVGRAIDADGFAAIEAATKLPGFILTPEDRDAIERSIARARDTAPQVLADDIVKGYRAITKASRIVADAISGGGGNPQRNGLGLARRYATTRNLTKPKRKGVVGKPTWSSVGGSDDW